MGLNRPKIEVKLFKTDKILENIFLIETENSNLKEILFKNKIFWYYKY